MNLMKDTKACKSELVEAAEKAKPIVQRMFPDTQPNAGLAEWEERFDKKFKGKIVDLGGYDPHLPIKSFITAEKLASRKEGLEEALQALPPSNEAEHYSKKRSHAEIGWDNCRYAMKAAITRLLDEGNRV